jgi:sugar transferase (PEP-CTERM system associated)
MQLFNRHVSARGLTAFGFETGLIAAAILIAAAARGSLAAATGAVWKLLLATALCELCFYYHDLYDLTLVHSRLEFLVRLLRATGTAALVLAVACLVVPNVIIADGVFLIWLLLVLLTVPAWRLAFEGVAHDPHLEQRVLFVGAGGLARTVAREIQHQHDFAYRVIGFVEEPDEPGAPRAADGDEALPLVGTTSDLPQLVEALKVDRIVVGLSDRRGHLPIQELLSAKLSGVRVEDATTTYERIAGKILTEGLTPSWLVFSDGFRASRATRAIKRAIDLGLAGAGLIVAAPLMLLTALAVHLDSPGPILYRQDRVGESGQVFTLVKFRSMRVDAERGTPVWASDDDDRVTRVGRFIRKVRLDELPQLWNVLRGEMSFVGPRPERPYFVRQLSAAVPFYAERHAVKPGVTGWAQVKYRYGCSVEDAIEKLRYDLYYIKHLSIVFDLTIVIDTVKVIVSGRGAQ